MTTKQPAPIKRSWKIVSKKPASWAGSLWREALPSGNGTIGAAVYGGVCGETVMINHADLWYGCKRGSLPDVSHTLPEVRSLMDDGNYREASVKLVRTLEESGYESARETPLQLADMKVTRSAVAGFRHYRRTLDMETGEVTVGWSEGGARFERALFASRQDDCLVYEIRSVGGTVDAVIELTPHDKTEDTASGIPKCVLESAESAAEGTYIRYAATNDDGLDFGAVLRALPQGGTVASEDGKLVISGADSVLLLVCFFVKGERKHEWRQLERRLEGMASGYGELLDRHAALHGPLFRSAQIRLHSGDQAASTEEWLLEAYEGELPAGLAETMWAFGRYLLISGTRPDGQPFPLYGLWGGNYRAMWSHHMANENVQMMYWHTAVGGLSELTLAMFAYYERMMEQFRDNARKLFGCRGIFIPAGTTPGNATPFQVVPVIMNWTGAAGWLSRHFYDYYLFTGDMEFLRERALPFMREAALFYEDFLVEGTDGQLKFYPSVSPENTPLNFLPQGAGAAMAHPMPTAINATLDVAIARELLGSLIEGSRTAQMYEEQVAEWESMLAKLPSYEINEDGAAKEWLYPDFEDRYHHRHISHIYPVFPAHEVSKQSAPELFQAFAVAVQKRLVIGIGDQTAWSFSHLANIYARMEEGELALECLSLLARSCLLSNLFTVHNDWRGMGVSLKDRRAPVQLDANMGWVSAVQEMLLYVSAQTVKLLPALPEAWQEGAVEGLRLCTGRISFSWNVREGRFEAALEADRETDITLLLPRQFTSYSWHSHGEASAVEAEGSASANWGRMIHVNMRAGGKLCIVAGGTSSNETARDEETAAAVPAEGGK